MTHNEWFIWERQGTIHPLFIVLEAAMEPLRDYFGYSWPDTTLIYNKDVVKWCNSMDKLKELGQKIIDFYIVEKNFKKMQSDLKKDEKKLVQVFKKIDKANLEKLSNEDLQKLYREFRVKYIEWFKIGWFVEPVSIQAEELLKQKTKNQHDFSLLTSATRDSFSKRELEDLIQIGVKKIKGKSIENDLEKHAKNYFWLQNSYFNTLILDEKYFRKQLDRLIKEYPDPTQYLKEIIESDKKLVKDKKELISKSNLSKKEKSIVKLVDFFGWFQDYRKEYVLLANYYLSLLLKEIGRRNKYTLKEMNYVFPKEIPDVFYGAVDKSEIKKRMKNSVIVWKEFYNDYEFFTGSEAKKIEKKMFKDDKSTKNILEFPGRSANLGVVRGKAMVTFDPLKAKKINEGDILVTSMTSPDFIEAMKKASAVVTDEGGITSHAAILAREFGVPCVVGTRIATKVIKTGDVIEVDGNHGFVRKIQS